jgi:teichuronic acid biosynthesis glycosyltransferase TuaH
MIPVFARRALRKLPLSWRYRAWSRYCKLRAQGGMGGGRRGALAAELEQLGCTGSSRVVWFLHAWSWFASAFQRPQQLARALGEEGCKVIYWEPWWRNERVGSPASDHEQGFEGFRRVGNQVYLLRCRPGDHLFLIRHCQPEWLFFYQPYQALLIPNGCTSRTIYEMTDDQSLDGVGKSWAREHHKWVRAADIVTASADDLLAQLRPDRPDALLVSNGVRIEDWAGAGTQPVPGDLQAARQKPVVVGYYGAIAEWMDFDLWRAAARLRPDWAFVWIGFPLRPGMVDEIAEVAKLPNAFYLGKKPYRELPAYLAYFDVATIPFLLNPITHACSPVKLFEYMAAGKPVVATRMREILKYRSVRFADTAQEFVAQIEVALKLRDDPDYRRVLRSEAEANTWRARAKALCRAMEEREKGKAVDRGQRSEVREEKS